jgi:hypothetical protein
MNYTDLEQSIKNFCESNESTFVSQINSFIRGAEDTVFSAVKGALFWKAQTSQTFIPSTELYDVASGAIDVLDFYVSGPDANTGGKSLEQVDHSFIREAFPKTSGAPEEGFPRYYALIESKVETNEPNITIQVAPVPDSAYEYEISYYGKSTTDSITSGNTPGVASTTETWLSLAYPDVLLYGALERAYIFLKGDQQDVDRYGSMFRESLTLLKNTVEGRLPTDESTSMSTPQTKGI